jgi:hypothetical protein
LTSHINSFGIALLALGVYALGKTFFWPTMLAVAADRFPRTGAIAIERECLIRLRFRLIDGCVSGGINHYIGTKFGQCPFDRRRV